jgi:Tol biopolymer transport system component
MTDVELDVADSFERVFPVPTVVADWDDVLDRAGARSGTPTRPPSRWRVVAIAVAIVGGAALLVAPAFGIGDRLLALIQGAPARPDVRSPVWSPGGRRIAFVSRRDGKALYVMNADGSGLRIVARVDRLTTPAWSPDGREIVYGRNGVYVMNADGSGQRQLARRGSAPAWSPDGRRIAFVITGKLYVVNADGSGHRTLTRLGRGGGGASLAWSPDGRKLLLVVKSISAPGCGYCSRLWVLNADGSGLRDLTRNLGGSRGFGAWPASDAVWSPDGPKIAFVRSNTRHGVYVINADGSGVRNLTPKPRGAAYAAPAWSPDGRKIAFAGERDGNSEIYLMNADGSGQRSLTSDLAYDGDPSWSPDGRKITFVSNRDGRYAVYVMNADGSGQRRLTQHGS